MQTTLLTTGIACLIGAIVGGGLKAFSIELPVLNSWRRQIALGVLGLILIAIGLKPGSKPIATNHGQVTPPHLTINYSQRGGPFVVLGPSGGLVKQGYFWHEMDILIQNSCKEAVYVDPTNFSLYLSSKPRTDDAERVEPTLLGTESRPGRLAAGWLQPSGTTSGRLVFEVPEKTHDGTETNGAYHILRFSGQSSCLPEYKPY